MDLDMPKILITGRTGQVGFELQRSLSVLGDIVAMDRTECDLSKPVVVRQAMQRIRPHVIVNPAAYTEVDKAETEPDLAYAVNASGPEVLAQEAVKLNALLIHYSTDYVFDGCKTELYKESDTPNPQSVYGKTKLGGEEAIRVIHNRHLILRTSWVYGAYGNNFLKTVLRLARERDHLRIVADQYGAPTSASLIADVTAQIVGQYLKERDGEKFPYGTYHLAAAGETTWHGYAQAILRRALASNFPLKVQPQAVEPIPTSAYPLLAPRPANSRLNTAKLQNTFGLALPEWHLGLDQAIALLFN